VDPALPQPVRLSLDQALAQWRHWSPGPAARPTVCGTLTGGRSNTSILVEQEQRQWVVRVDGFNPTSLGLNRSAERRCLAHAARAGLAPRPVYWNPDCRVLVTEYLRADGDAPDALPDIAQLLRRIHTLPAIRTRLNPLARARRYLDLAGADTLPAELLAACKRLASDPVPARLCHNDLLRPNRLYSEGRLLALDWEYAAMGDPCFDLAVVIEGDNLNDAQARSLHEEWLGHAANAAELARLADQRLVYRELAALWEAIPRG